MEELGVYKNRADIVLIDAPCSGLGVLRRNPDTKWKLAETDLENLIKTQAIILRQHTALVRIGGAMVYATCSILPAENQSQISSFLAENKNWLLEAEVNLLPHREGYDGFYMARLRKMG